MNSREQSTLENIINHYENLASFDYAAKAAEKGKRRRHPPETEHNIDELYNVGGLQLARFLTSRANFSVRSASILTCPRTFAEEVLPSEVRQPDHADTVKFIQQDLFIPLNAAGLVKSLDVKPISYVRIFLVRKKNLKKRIIAHPAWLNERGLRPPKLRLWNVEGLLYLLSSMTTYFTLDLDFVNWFYQIPVGEHIRRVMALVRPGHKWLYLALCVLCMGWSWSPFLAQALAWTIILHREEDEPALGVPESVFSADIPPHMINLTSNDGSSIGFITCIYDNILIVVNSSEMRDQWVKRINRNMRYFNAKPKYLNTGEGNIDFNGVEIEKIRNGIRWRINTATFNSWSERLNDTSLRITGANVAAIQNTVVCFHVTRRTNLRTMARLFKMTRPILRTLDTKSSWKKPLNKHICSNETFASIREWGTTLQNDWRSFLSVPTIFRKIHCLAVDAVPTSIGITFIDYNSGAEQHTPTTQFHIPLTEITLAEARAIVTGVRSYISCFDIDLERDLFMIASDNTGSSHAISKGWSGVDEIDAEIILFDELLRSKSGKPGRFIIVDVPTGENVADSPSRGEPVCPTRLMATHSRLKRALPFVKKGFLWVDRHMIPG